ncbi:MAG: NADPH:quinone oxidoreductase family protein [Casimicrobiaceae bacterium]|nr:NADPH:quinone oxidoreductase family protein [Casimicrobiaceae bacterium]MDW8312206.1 NADPH:quinone oxidoreductase family protein [Burkholderiales bacterium]
MKAWLCREFASIEALTLVEVPEPQAAAGEVVVAVRAASLNFPDALIVQGKYQVRPPLPFVPGAEFAGVVHAIGEGVSQVKVGDRVICIAGTGGFAEYAAVPVRQVLPLPVGFDFEQAAAFVFTYGTSLWALRNVGALQAGETVLILGASGGVGTAAIQIAKAMGARVIAAASSDEKLALCARLGADHTVNYSEEGWRERVNEIVGKAGLDVVFDAVGGPYSEPALRSLGWRGRFLVVGFAAGEIPKIPLNLALLRERQILGVYWGDSMMRHPQAHAANLQQLAEWFAQGKLAPAITRRYGFDEVRDALLDMANRRVLGKVVVRVSP